LLPQVNQGDNERLNLLNLFSKHGRKTKR